MSTQIMVDAAAGGSLNNKTPKQSWELFEVMTSNNYQRPIEITQKRGVLEVDTNIALLAQMQALSVQNVAIRSNWICSTMSHQPQFCAVTSAKGTIEMESVL